MGKKILFKSVKIEKVYTTIDVEIVVERVRALSNLSDEKMLMYARDNFSRNEEIMNHSKEVGDKSVVVEEMSSYGHSFEMLENEDGYDYGMERNEDIKGDLSEFEGTYADDDVE